MSDHDALIRLEAKVDALVATTASQNTGSVERDTRIEAKVDRINGTVRRHDETLNSLQTIEAGDVSRRKEHDELWTAYKLGKWIMGGITVALVGQSVALVALVLNVT